MSGENKPISGPKLSIVHPKNDDPLDGSGAADAPDGWYESDRLGHARDTPGEADGDRPTNASRIVDHLKSILSAARRDDV
ncbi:hypothetical protein ACFW16_33095 [Inquilinus sp. NPDC058860]|uniref:hypothetical protein n=1 Tax=Inquilinus sp. NPDC058860 TaxID=3346652 RepID=UPI0036819082